MIKTAQLLCLIIPIFGSDDPNSTCLTQAQMERRAVVLQCEQATARKPIPGNRTAELHYIITGSRDSIGIVAVTVPERPRFRCIWERSE